MGRGLSQQQRKILATLKTKQIPNSERGYFSTQEVIISLHPEYLVWLTQVDSNPFTLDRKHHINYQKYDKIRVSVYRALRSLERRGHVISFRMQNARFWTIPERLKNKLLKERSWTQQDYEERGIAWRWAAFIRTLPNDLRLKYKLGIVTENEKQQLNHLWNEHKKNNG